MFRSRLILVAALALFAAPAAAQDAPRWSFAIHGGAGVIERASLTPEQDAAYRAALHRALEQAAGDVQTAEKIEVATETPDPATDERETAVSAV